MKKIAKFFIILCLLFFLPLISAHAQDDQVSIPNITPNYIKRYSYINQDVGGIIKAKSGSSKDSSSASGGINVSAIATSVGGIASVVGGSVFTWIKLKGRNKTFNKYFTTIDQTAQEIMKNVNNEFGVKDKQKALALALTRIQEKAELSAANKKIDENQLIAITNHIKRKIEEAS